MDYPAFFIPPVYQRAPEGSADYLGPNKVPPSTAASSGVLTGTGAPPDSLGKDGDLYFELSANGSAVTFWDTKKDGHWPSSGIALGGVAAISADGPPSDNAVGPLGQIYIDRLNAVLYMAQAS